MAYPLKYFVVFCLLSMVSQGLCRCTFDDIEIGTERTGREVAGKLEWKVSVINTCKCWQKNVTLSCGGFDPVNPVDPSLLLPQDDNKCLVIKGDTLQAGGKAEFTYAGEPFIFRAFSSVVDPSCKS